MFDAFMSALQPTASDTVLDVGATSDETYEASNYFEAMYPFRDKVVACGIDGGAAALETRFPGLRFAYADACDLPFADRSFDLVHSSAVIEHVGSFERQSRMVAECLRVARRGVFITTPNKWFPVEVHTTLPLLHWLPPRAFRFILRRSGYDYFAEEANLNLMSRSRLARIASAHKDWSSNIATHRLLGWRSNLLFVARR